MGKSRDQEEDAGTGMSKSMKKKLKGSLRCGACTHRGVIHADGCDVQKASEGSHQGADMDAKNVAAAE